MYLYIRIYVYLYVNLYTYMYVNVCRQREWTRAQQTVEPPKHTFICVHVEISRADMLHADECI